MKPCIPSSFFLLYTLLDRCFSATMTDSLGECACRSGESLLGIRVLYHDVYMMSIGFVNKYQIILYTRGHPPKVGHEGRIMGNIILENSIVCNPIP